MHPIELFTIGLVIFGALIVYQIHMARNIGFWIILDVLIALSAVSIINYLIQ